MTRATLWRCMEAPDAAWGMPCAELGRHGGPASRREPGQQLSSHERTNGGANFPALRVADWLHRRWQYAQGILADDIQEPAHHEDCSGLESGWGKDGGTIFVMRRLLNIVGQYS